MYKTQLKHIIKDIAIAVIVAAIHCYLYFVLIFASYGFFTCGNEYLNQWNNIRTGFLVTVVIFIIELIVCYYTFRRSTKVRAVSSWILVASVLFPVLQLGESTFNVSNYYKDFDSKSWKNAKEKPLSMIRKFYEDKRFIGKTKKEIMDELGEGEKRHYSDSNMIIYNTDGYLSPFVISFKNGKVDKYYLICED